MDEMREKKEQPGLGAVDGSKAEAGMKPGEDPVKAAGTLAPIRLFLASDSTCQNYNPEETKQSGWGMFIGEHLAPAIAVENRAIGGRSSKSFLVEGRLDAIARDMKAGDWLLVQLGHNDASRDKPERYTEPFREYRDYLRRYVQVARECGGQPLLATPVARLHYEDGRFINDFPDYCSTMRELAQEEGVPFVDLMGLSLEHFHAVGYDAAYPYFMVSVNGTDHTHFTEAGARTVAALLASAIRRLGIGLSEYVRGS